MPSEKTLRDRVNTLLEANYMSDKPRATQFVLTIIVAEIIREIELIREILDGKP